MQDLWDISFSIIAASEEEKTAWGLWILGCSEASTLEISLEFNATLKDALEKVDWAETYWNLLK